MRWQRCACCRTGRGVRRVASGAAEERVTLHVQILRDQAEHLQIRRVAGVGNAKQGREGRRRRSQTPSRRPSTERRALPTSSSSKIEFKLEPDRQSSSAPVNAKTESSWAQP